MRSRTFALAFVPFALFAGRPAAAAPAGGPDAIVPVSTVNADAPLAFRVCWTCKPCSNQYIMVGIGEIGEAYASPPLCNFGVDCGEVCTPEDDEDSDFASLTKEDLEQIWQTVLDGGSAAEINALVAASNGQMWVNPERGAVQFTSACSVDGNPTGSIPLSEAQLAGLGLL